MSGRATDDRLTTELESADLNRRLRAIRRLKPGPGVALSGRALELLAGCLGKPNKELQRRAGEALAASADYDRRVVTAVRGRLKSPDRQTRWGAVYALGLLGEGALDLSGAGCLLEALSDLDSDVRWAAAELVVRLGREYPAGMRARLLGLTEAGDPIARRMALYCLRDLRFGGADVIAAVDRASRSADSRVRLAALSALARLGGAREEAAATALKCLESDVEAGVRRAAAASLGRLGDRSPRVLAALRHASEDQSDAALGRAARLSLKELG